MENSAQKAGFAIAAMIIVIVAAGVAVDWWDAYHLRHSTNGGPLGDPVLETSAEQGLKQEIERLKLENQFLQGDIEELRKQLQSVEKKELAPMKKEPDALKPESEPVKSDPPGDGPISEN
jgi:hypothetical protein